MGIKQYFRKQKILSKARKLTSSISQLELILKIGSQYDNSHANFLPIDIDELRNSGYIDVSLKSKYGMKRVIMTIPETSQPIYITLTKLGEELYKYIRGWINKDLVDVIESPKY